MIDKIRDLAMSKEYSMEERRFFLAGVVAVVAVFSVMLSTITSRQSLPLVVVFTAALLMVILAIYYSIKYDNYILGGSVIILLSNVIVCPIGYFLVGGLDSGAALWLVLSIVFVFVLFKGTLFFIYLFITLAMDAAVMYLAAQHPEWTTPLAEGYSPYLDSYISLVLVAIICGTLFMVQSKVLEDEVENAEKQAEEISKLAEMQTNFFSTMSHEIRTPISTIIGLNEMTMREKQLPAEVYENTLNIQNASKMLLSLINDILDMSKIQSGKMEITPVEYDTSRMLSEITNMHWNRALEKDLRFDIQVSENIPPMLYGDETRIKQVINNLLSNAIKYTEEGSVTLRIGGERGVGDKFTLSFEVQDTGIGIRRENIQYVFDSFRRVEGDDTRNIEGTGLGLSISKQLVELMGGTITVNSIYTKGSTFRVEFPQKVVESGELTFHAPGTRSMEQVEYKQSFEAPKAAVLVVDDNDLNRIVCRKLLRATKVQVDLAESGAECLEKTAEKHYDAIFMDHEMPNMDGIETLRNLRQQTNGLCKDTPVIALTANAGSDREQFYADKGFSAYLSKPIQSSRLEALLMACLPDSIIEKRYGGEEGQSIRISDTAVKKPFAITTDSISDIPEEIAKKYDIKIMPYYIQTVNGRFRDIEEIDADNLQSYIKGSGTTVHSDPAPVEEYEAFFGEALTSSRYVLHLSPSQGASGAYKNAALAAESFGNVYVVDTGTISSGLGLMAIRAADLLGSGMRVEDVIHDLEQYITRVELMYLVPKLSSINSKYTMKPMANFLLNVLNVEPVFTIRKGQFKVRKFMLGYVRSTADAFIRYAFLNNRNIDKKRLFVTFSGCSTEEKARVLQELERYVQFDEIIVNKGSASTFANIGPDSFGFTFEKIHTDR